MQLAALWGCGTLVCCLASSVILALSAHLRMFGNTSTHSAGRSFADARQLELCALCEV